MEWISVVMPSGTSLSRSTVQRRASGSSSREANSSSNSMRSNSVAMLLALHELLDQIELQLMFAVSQVTKRHRKVRDRLAILAEHVDLVGRLLQPKEIENLGLLLGQRRSDRRVRVQIVLLCAEIAHIKNEGLGIQSNSPECARPSKRAWQQASRGLTEGERPEENR